MLSRNTRLEYNTASQIPKIDIDNEKGLQVAMLCRLMLAERLRNRRADTCTGLDTCTGHGADQLQSECAARSKVKCLACQSQVRGLQIKSATCSLAWNTTNHFSPPLDSSLPSKPLNLGRDPAHFKLAQGIRLMLYLRRVYEPAHIVPHWK